MLSSTKNITFTLTSLLYLALLIAGIWLDQQTALSQLQLMIAFHSAGIVGLVTTL